jgi:hypothetical protein
MLAGLLSAACSNPAPTGDQQSRSKVSVDSKERNACSLLDTADIEAIFGKKLVPKSEGLGQSASKCLWMEISTGLGPYLMLTAYWEGGREVLNVEKKARGLANKVIDEPEAEKLTGFGPVPKLGDEAYLSKSFLASYVLKGETLLEFQLPLANEMQLRTNFVPLAQKALSRLGSQ